MLCILGTAPGAASGGARFAAGAPIHFTDKAHAPNGSIGRVSLSPDTIVPTLIWSTFLGSSGLDFATSSATDTSGNSYVTGYSVATWSAGECSGCPVDAFSGGVTDAFLAKIDPTGNLVWVTFLGGNGDDYAYNVAVAQDNALYVVGYSNATWGTPIRAYTPSASPNDAFAAKVDAGGHLVWNTFLGGTGYDWGNGIAVDSSANVYVVGYSDVAWGAGDCTGCPVRAFTSAEDAYAAKLNSSGNLTWLTYLGGSAADAANKVVVADNGSIVVTGFSVATWGTPRRAYTSGYDGFATKVDSDGQVVWNTFLGGDGYDVGYGIARDSSGNVILAGVSSNTWGSPLRPYTADYDAFGAKLDADGNLSWNTFLGSSANDHGFNVAVDRHDDVYVIGHSFATWGKPSSPYTADADAFVAKISAGGVFSWNTFVGGSDNQVGRAIGVDRNGNLYLCGESYAGWGTPIRNYSGDVDGFFAKLFNPLRSPEVSGFKALVDSGVVRLQWRTTNESQIKGFNVWRKLGKAAQQQLNKQLINAKVMGSPSGARYRFKDSKAKQGKTYRYTVEVIYLDDHSEWSKEIKVLP